MQKLIPLLNRIESTTKTKEKAALFTEFLKSNTPSENTLYLKIIANEMVPYDIDLNVGESSVIMAGCKVSGFLKEEFVAKVKELGSVSNAMKYAIENKKVESSFDSDNPLTLEQILSLIQTLPETHTTNEKLYTIQQCITNQTPENARMITHFILRDLPMGYNIQKLIPVMADYLNMPEDVVQNAYNFTNYIHQLPIIDITKVRMTSNKPFKPQLADKFKYPVKSTLTYGEPKFDGGRIVVHVRKPLPGFTEPRINLYTRKLEDVSVSFPEIITSLKKFVVEHVEALPMIIDTEFMVGSKFTDFSSRIKRLNDIEAYSKNMPAFPYVFDVLMIAGQEVYQRPLFERIHIMDTMPLPERFSVVERIIAKNEEDIDTFFNKCVEEGYEGIMVKDGNAPYSINNRSSNWLKLKPTNTIDLYVVDYTSGTGKNAGKYSSFTIATGDGLAIGNVGIGMSDTLISELTDMVNSNIPIVFEITYDSIQSSTKYSSGYALRLPRVTSVRRDKSPKDCTMLSEIVKDSKVT